MEKDVLIEYLAGTMIDIRKIGTEKDRMKLKILRSAIYSVTAEKINFAKTADEIKKIREFDVRAQLKDDYDKIARRNEELYNTRIIRGDVVVLSSREGDNNSIACDKIVLDNPEKVPQILDLRQNNKGEIVFIYFSGPSEIVRKLKQECSPSFGGSEKTEKVSDFAGWIKPTQKQIEKIKQILNLE